MDRRSFLASLLGGLTVAGMGGAALAAQPIPASEPKDAIPAELPPVDAEALDKTDATYSQYYYRRRPRWRRRSYYRRRYYRPPYGRAYGYRRRRYYGGRRFDWRARSR